MKPWVRMYREERGTFAQLPLVCRGIAMEILKLTDDEGIIRIGRKDPIDAIAFALGATRSDRRALAQCVPMLLEDGFLVHDGDRLIVPGFPKFQADDRAANAPRPSKSPTPTAPRRNNESTSNRPRPSNEPTTTEQRTDHEEEPRSAKSDDGTGRALREIREEKTREEGEESALARTTPSAATERMLRSFAPIDREADVIREVSEARQRAGGAAFRVVAHTDRDAVSRLAEWSSGLNVEDLRRVLDAFFAAKGTGARLSWLVDEEPGRWLGTPRKRGRSAPIATHDEHAAIVAAHSDGRDHAIVEI